MLAIFVTTASAMVVEPSSEPSGSLPRRDTVFEEASAGSPAVPGWAGVRGDWVSLITASLRWSRRSRERSFTALDRVGEEKFCTTSPA
jgi:hypothetical protein